MQTDIWNNQIEITCDGGDHFKKVSSPRDALACLANYWPTLRGGHHAAARRACLKALKGEVPLSVAEAAFIKAAQEAGVLRH